MQTRRLRSIAPVAALVIACIAQTPAPVRAASDLVVPDAADLRIKRRSTINTPGAWASIEILALKGARQRWETIVDMPPRRGLPSGVREWLRIAQCDERRLLVLNPNAKTYAYEPIVDVSAERARIREAVAHQPSPPPAAADMAARPVVTITFDSVDTGERRTYGSYTARHVITTRKTEPGPGASTPAGVEEMDGWYLDLPDANCQRPDDGIVTLGAVLIANSPGMPIDRIEFKQRRTAPRGYAMEETRRATRGPGDTVPRIVARVELLEMSEAPLDPALFTVPAGYRPALPNPYGGHDMLKPDTVMNRLESYGNVIADWANRLFSFRARSY